MLSKKVIVLVLLLAISGFLLFYWTEQQHVKAVEQRVHAWQTSVADYLTFDYARVSARMWSHAIVLEEVTITYPLLMSIDKITIVPEIEDNIITSLEVDAQNINFTVPFATGGAPWQGNLQLDYQYDPVLKSMYIAVAPDFPDMLKLELEASLMNIMPDIDMVFNYPDVLLASLKVHVYHQKFMAHLQNAVPRDEQLAHLLQNFTTVEQQEKFIAFWKDGQPLLIQFYPEYPVAAYRLLDNERLFWQHPAVEMSNAQ